MHRDIKPNNIMVGPHDTVKLLDYGAAKELKDRDISATMVGSRPYMAPEQIMGRSQRRSDVWAIGVIMYLLYTGLLPFYDDLEKTLIDLILESEPPSPSDENPDIPPGPRNHYPQVPGKKRRQPLPQRPGPAGGPAAPLSQTMAGNPSTMEVPEQAA